ncbi:hypothetical protein HZS_7646 [Henneguya salminicola]|nr:hypothetical protein HZS_7646 [Henneguya salminicola]
MEYKWMPKTIATDFEKAFISAKIELLTIIPSHQIPVAIEYIKSLLTHEDAVDKFLFYFERTCLGRFPPNV